MQCAPGAVARGGAIPGKLYLSLPPRKLGEFVGNVSSETTRLLPLKGSNSHLLKLNPA